MDELILAKYRPANLKIQFHNARNLAIINDFAFLIRHPLKNQDQKKRVQNHGVGLQNNAFIEVTKLQLQRKR